MEKARCLKQIKHALCESGNGESFLCVVVHPPLYCIAIDRHVGLVNPPSPGLPRLAEEEKRDVPSDGGESGTCYTNLSAFIHTGLAIDNKR